MTVEQLRATNERLRIENDKMRQLLTSAAVLCDDVIAIRDALKDPGDIASELLAAIQVLGLPPGSDEPTGR